MGEPMIETRCVKCGMPDEFADLVACGGSVYWRCSDEARCAKRAALRAARPSTGEPT